MQNFRFYLPTDLHFGEGLISNHALYDLPYKRVLIVTTKNGSNAHYGALDTIRKNLDAYGIESVVYDQVTRPLTTKTILDAAAFAAAQEVDCLIAHGGAKVIDAAKLIARMAHENAAYLSGWLDSQLRPPFKHEPLDVIAIPTTLTLFASMNHKVYIYDGAKNRYERLKDSSFTPVKTWVDPSLMQGLPLDIVRNALSDVLIRAFELIRLEISPMHTDVAMNVFKRLIKQSEFIEDAPSAQTWNELAYAHVLMGGLYVKKPYFPLHMLNDTVQGFHPEIHYGRFLFFAAPTYVTYRLGTLSKKTTAQLEACFKEAGFEADTLETAFANVFTRMNPSEETMHSDRLPKHYPEDYLVHLKTLFPKFEALDDQTIYKLIETTML